MGDERHFYLKEWRLHRGLSQDELAARVETSKGYLSQIERGERPYSQHWLEAFAAALEISPQDLIGRPPPSRPGSRDKGLSDRGRRFGDAAAGPQAPFDAEIMATCIAAAFAIIAPRRNLDDETELKRAAADAAESAISQYLSYHRLIDEEKKPDAA